VNDSLDRILFPERRDQPRAEQSSLLLDPKTPFADDTWFWGSRGRPLLPERLRPFLQDRTCPLQGYRKGARVNDHLPLVRLLDGCAWDSIDYLRGPHLAVDVMGQLLAELTSTAVREIPVLDASLVNGEALARLPLMHRTLSRASDCGIDLAVLGVELPELTLGDLVDRFDRDLYAVLDVALSTHGWLAELGVGAWLREPTTDQTDVVIYGRFLARQVLASHRQRSVPEAHVTAIATLMGWSGQGPSTLEVAGRAAGLTRERVRQIRSPAVPDFGFRRRWPPPKDLVRAMELLEGEERAPVSDIESELHRRIATTHTLGLGAVLALAEEGGVRHEVAVSHGVVHGRRNPYTDRARQIVTCAQRTGGKTGFTTLQRIVGCLSDPPISRQVARNVLAVSDGVLALDNDNYFVDPGTWMIGASHRMLAANPQISLDAFRAGLVKRFAARRIEPPPPMAVLRDFFSRDRRFRLDGNIVSSAAPLDVDTSAQQWRVVELLRDAPGGALHFDELSEACRRRGIPQGSVVGYCGQSELIAKAGPSIYTIVGRQLPPGTVERVRQRALSANLPMHLDAAFIDGQTFVITGLLNRKSCNYGTISTTAPIRSVVGSDTFQIVGTGRDDGSLALGKDQQLHGFARIFTRIGADEGDELRVELDVLELTAHVRVSRRDVDATFER
jgi:hypothetical protein